MMVRLIAMTKPVIPECEAPGDLLAYCARVSNPGNQANSETASRLLAYLVRKAHWSPFEMASMTLEIVHRAECHSPEQMAALLDALCCAERVRIALEPTWRGGAASKYPTLPTACVTPNV